MMATRRLPTGLLLGLLGLGTGCASSTLKQGPEPSGAVARIDVTPSPDTIHVSSSDQLTAVAYDSADQVVGGASFTWSSSKTGVATVGTSGQVLGVAPGTAVISAKADGITGQATVVVQAVPGGVTVAVTPADDSVPVGSVLALRATVRDGNGTILPNALVTWTSGAPGTATVAPSGFVTGIGNGTATITANYGGTTGTTTVKVRGAFARTDQAMVPLLDAGSGTYLGFPGSLYPGSNALPSAHRSAGLSAAAGVVPRNAAGNPASGGTYVLMSIGMSNTTQEWCTAVAGDPCESWSFMGQAAADPLVRTSGLRILNGAHSGATADDWDSPLDPNYDRVRDSVLTPAGLTEKQVAVVWLKVADANPTVSLPNSTADAFVLEGRIGQILRATRSRYPNLKLVFVSSRIYAGYANTTLNPEPYAFESGFSDKWVIDAQIRQMAAGGSLVDPVAGDLNYSKGVAPWVAWGPYLWADGTNPRSDGLTWVPGDFDTDGTHPGTAGETKVADALLDFFLTSPLTRCWFVKGGTCP